MRMRDQRNAARRLFGQIERELEGAGRTGDRQPLLAARHFIFSGRLVSAELYAACR
jgi:hypothetical protein